MFVSMVASNYTCKQNWIFIIILLLTFLSFLYYYSWPGFMGHAIAKHEGEGNNTAFVMDVTASKERWFSKMVLKDNSQSLEPGFMGHAEGDQNNIAFVMEVTASKDGSQSRFIYRFKQCLASICQRSSINLTLHIFANALGKEESLKVLEEVAPYCIIRYRVKFYDVDEVIRNILPSINVIKVSECHLNEHIVDA